MTIDDSDNTFARFDIDDSGDLWLWFDQPVQRFRIRRDQAEHLYAMLDAEFSGPSLLPLINPDELRTGRAYLAYLEPAGPPTNRYKVFIDTNVFVNGIGS